MTLVALAFAVAWVFLADPIALRILAGLGACGLALSAAVKVAVMVPSLRKAIDKHFANPS
jgi:hypothetical protein